MGGITELNFNIRSENASGTGGGTATNATTGTLGGSVYVMNVGLDMRLVNTNTLEVADVISYQKQIIGHQISAGVFDFMGTNFFDLSAGESALEPIQLAVRSVIERAALEMVTRIYRIPSGGGICASPLNTAADPLGDGRMPYQASNQPNPAYRPTAYSMENNNDSRQNPYRGYSSGDAVGDVRLRGEILDQSSGSNIINGQINLQSQFSNLTGNVDTIEGDAVVQGAAAGNMIDITTMNNTRVQNSQIVGPSAAIDSNINTNVSNVWGSVGVTSQAICNGASVSTDPTLTQVNSYQKCDASDPASSIKANVTNIAGDAVVQSMALGNSFEADSNAPNMPIVTKQINNSMAASTVHANVSNVGGSTSLTSSAIGNTAQIIHYSTN